MNNFKIVKKGYDRAEVDAFIVSKERINRDILQEKNIRIEELKQEINSLREQLTKLKQREESVNSALVTAVERAKEMDYATKIRFTLEGERIRLFRAKWEVYCDKYKNKLGVQEARGELTGLLKDAEKELLKIMKADLRLDGYDDTLADEEQQYLEEAKRIMNIAKEYGKDGESTGNRKESAEELCRKIGVSC